MLDEILEEIQDLMDDYLSGGGKEQDLRNTIDLFFASRETEGEEELGEDDPDDTDDTEEEDDD